MRASRNRAAELLDPVAQLLGVSQFFLNIRGQRLLERRPAMTSFLLAAMSWFSFRLFLVERDLSPFRFGAKVRIGTVHQLLNGW